MRKKRPPTRKTGIHFKGGLTVEAGVCEAPASFSGHSLTLFEIIQSAVWTQQHFQGGRLDAKLAAKAYNYAVSKCLDVLQDDGSDEKMKMSASRMLTRLRSQDVQLSNLDTQIATAALNFVSEQSGGGEQGADGFFAVMDLRRKSRSA